MTWFSRVRLGWLTALMMLFGTIAAAYEVSPMRVILVPAEGRTQATISINNTREKALPVELRVFRRRMTEDGAQTFDPADDDFIVFPLQVEIPAGKSQAVRFQYLGAAQLSESEGYVLQVTEVPVSPPGFSGLNVAYNFGVAVYVEPPRAVERLSVVSSTVQDGTLALRIRNDGDKYALLTERSLIVDAGGKQLEVNRNTVAELVENPLIPPNSIRLFRLPLAAMGSPGNVTVRLRDERG